MKLVAALTFIFCFSNQLLVLERPEYLPSVPMSPASKIQELRGLRNRHKCKKPHNMDQPSLRKETKNENGRLSKSIGIFTWNCLLHASYY